jgi:hypothetical protein
MDAREFQTLVDATAGRVAAALASEPKTAWDLKMELKVPHTLVHIALGRLLGEGKVALRPEGYTILAQALRPAEAPASAATASG